MPNNAPTEVGGIALYSLTEYGRLGCYPTFDDTTEYRQCLNGNRGRFKSNRDNLPLVNAIAAAMEIDNPENQQRLLDELCHRTLLFSVTVPDEELEKKAFSADTPIRLISEEWEGKMYFFAYTDATYRLEPSHGCIGVDGRGLAAFVRQFHENAGVLINPAGPAACRLDPSALSALANEA